MPGTRPIHVVFVHGLFSKADVWERFTTLINNDRELSPHVTLHTFSYDTRWFRVRPDRRISDIDTIAEQVRTRIDLKIPEDEPVVLVAHSLGGLIVQRMLARRVRRGEARALARIKLIVLYACPNNGAQFFQLIRKWLLRRQPQDRQLRPLDEAVQEAQQDVLRTIVNARELTDTTCHIPIVACAGTTDGVVPRALAVGIFPEDYVVEGDHKTIIQPPDAESFSYLVLKKKLLEVIDAQSGALPVAEGGAEDEPAAPEAATSQNADSAAAHSSAGGTDSKAARKRDDPSCTPGPPNRAEPDQPPHQGGDQSVDPPFGRMDIPLKGRDALIREILDETARSRVHVLAGLGGMGKSRLALELARRRAREGWDVWWVQGSLLNVCMKEIAARAGATSHQIEVAFRGTEDPTELVWNLLADRTRPWMIIFDDVNDPQALGPLDGEVSKGTGWLRPPTGARGEVLVTTQDHNQATWGPWSTVHVVGPLDEEAGAALLMETTKQRGGNSGEARELAKELGGLPMALRAAGEYIRAVNDTRLATRPNAIPDFRTYRAEVRERFTKPPSSGTRPLDEELGLEILQYTFGVSLELLTENGLPQAAPLLKLFACLNTAPIPHTLLLNDDRLAASPLFSGHPDAWRRGALERLADLNFVHVEPSPGTSDGRPKEALSLHPVVHGVLRHDPDVRERFAEYYGLNIRLLLAATRDRYPDQQESWATWGMLAPHCIEVVRAVLLSAAPPPDRGLIVDALELARLTARYLLVRGLLRPARALIPLILYHCRRLGLERVDPDVLNLRHELGRMYLESGDPEAAEEELRQVVEARMVALGRGHRDTWASRHKLARSILEQRRWTEAEFELRQVVDDKPPGTAAYDEVVVRHSFARALLAKGDPAQAEQEIRSILKICERLSPKLPETLFIRQTLTRCLLEQGRAVKAEEEARDALRTVLDDDPDLRDAPVVMMLRNALVTALLFLGRVPEAYEQATDLLVDMRKVRGEEHPDTRLLARVLEDFKRTPGDNS